MLTRGSRIGLRHAAGAALCTLALGCAQQVAVSGEVRPVCVPGAAAPAAPTAAAAPPTAGILVEAPLNSVNITDIAVINKLAVQSTNARRNPTGTVEVWARLVNCTDFALQVEARTHFLDEGQAPVEPVSAWSRVFLPARSYGVYTGSSTNVYKVRYYYVEVREGR